MNAPTLTRRTTVLAAAGAFGALVAPAPALAAQGGASLSAPALLRSIDPSDEDFSDLEPMRRAIGEARVIQLGEPSHGAGSAFAAKARLVKFLHSRMGFDLLIWESGLYDVGLTEAGLNAGEDPVTAARRGIFGLWANAREVAPLFAYAAASRLGRRPLTMAGFDMQVTAPGSRQRFALDLKTFVAVVRDEKIRGIAMAEAEAALAARDRLFANRFAEASDLEQLLKSVAGLNQLVGRHRAAFDAASEPLTTEFMLHAIENVGFDASQRFGAARSPAATVDRENRRDARNFQILRWLLERRYPRRKAIIWAHNAHIMNAFYAPDFRVARARGQPGDMRPMGVDLKQWLGNEVYTLGITAYEGADALAAPGAPTRKVAAAEPRSLEAHLHALAAPYLFVDFARSGRRIPTSVATARYPKYDANAAPDVAQAYDGLLFLDDMKAATAPGA